MSVIAPPARRKRTLRRPKAATPVQGPGAPPALPEGWRDDAQVHYTRSTVCGRRAVLTIVRVFHVKRPERRFQQRELGNPLSFDAGETVAVGDCRGRADG